MVRLLMSALPRLFNQRRTGSQPQRGEREALVADLARLIEADTQRLIDIEQTEMEEYALANGMPDVPESNYAAIRNSYAVGFPAKYLKTLETETLRALQKAFSPDPEGFNDLIRDSPVRRRSCDVFFLERLMYPMKTKATSFGTERTYRMARNSLNVESMTELPVSQREGVMAVLTVSNFWAEYHADHHFDMGLSDSGAQMTPDLAALLMEMPDKAPSVIDYLRERRMELQDADPAHMREMFTTDSQALSAGVL